MKVTMPPSTIHLKETAVSADTMKEKKLRNACAGFEAIFIKQMLRTMREGAPEGGLFGKGFATEMYQAMFDEELAETLAQGKGMGLGESLYKQISGQVRQKAGNNKVTP